ncbi:MAG: outer membrane protein [Pseudomonadota bacterium]
MKKTLLAGCAAATLSLFAVQAHAADVTPVAEPNGFYVSLFGGASFLDRVETNIYSDDTDYKVDTKTGYILGGAIGMRIWEPIRAEVEVSYSRWAVDDARFKHMDGDVPHKGDAEGDGHLSATYVLGNLWYDFQTDSGFTPYVGGGAGIGFVGADVTFFDDDYGFDDADSGFAFQAGLGVKVDLTESIAVDVGYRFKGILDVDFDNQCDNNCDDFTGGDLYSHNVQAGLTFGF